MKKYLFILAAAFCFSACDKEEISAPFDDIIAGFDVAKMDQVQLIDALTSSFVEQVDGMVHYPHHGWIPFREIISTPEAHYLFYADGGCWGCCTTAFVIGSLLRPIHTQMEWEYDTTSGSIFIGETAMKKKPHKILYYKNDRLIMEHIAYNVNGEKLTYRVVYQLHFGEEVRKGKAEYYKTTLQEWQEMYPPEYGL